MSVNFGQRPFVFDIDGMMAREQMAVENEIMATKPTSLRPPSDEDTLIQELVAHFLAHDGYVETAKAFASERRAASVALRGTQDSSPGAIEVEDDLDAVNRQSELPFHGIVLLLICLFRNSSRNTRRRYRQSSKAYPCVLSTCT